MVRLLSLFDIRTFGVSMSLKGKHTRMAVNDLRRKGGGHRGRISDDEPAKQEVNRERRYKKGKIKGLFHARAGIIRALMRLL